MMSEVNDFVLAHGTRLLGIAETAVFTVLLIRTRDTPRSGREAFWYANPLAGAVLCIGSSLLLQFSANAFDWLTFKVIGVGTALLGAGYAFLLFAGYRFFTRSR